MQIKPLAGAITCTAAGLAAVAVALSGAVPATADPVEPTPMPVPSDPAVVAAGQPAAPGDLAAVPAPPPVQHPSVPEIANPTYGSGQGIFGTIADLWQQVRNPYYGPGEGGEAAAPPPGAGPAPALPPGYVSINAPGSETASTASTGPAAAHPALPPGYYSLSGPPPPGYEFGAPTAPVPAAPPTP